MYPSLLSLLRRIKRLVLLPHEWRTPHEWGLVRKQWISNIAFKYYVPSYMAKSGAPLPKWRCRWRGVRVLHFVPWLCPFWSPSRRRCSGCHGHAAPDQLPDVLMELGLKVEVGRLDGGDGTQWHATQLCPLCYIWRTWPIVLHLINIYNSSDNLHPIPRPNPNPNQKSYGPSI